MPINSRDIGKQAEQQARHHLEHKGLTFREQNFSCKHGEIDLIMLDKDALVFVEVRYRKNHAYGGAAASVTIQKQTKVRHSAEYYLQINELTTACRFDVVAISANDIEWICGAF
ncbi:YraN family protein [Agaribacterium sp. ZY112]|uniref:YraN family protein n=1 Tax=Agaribacterium sp. ZY112 TaxID=3233574 RepID=UPI003524C08D